MANNDIIAINKRLRETFASGKTRKMDWRRGQLEALYKMTSENREVFAEAMRKDLGKPKTEALLADIGYVEGEIAHTMTHLEEWTAPTFPSVKFINKFDGCQTLSEPLGVVLNIAPWNYPVQLAVGPVASAVAAGNCCVVKPSELAPHTSEAIAALFPKYMDPEAIAVVEGGIPETTLLLEQRWDHIAYTGNPMVARIIMTAAAKHLTPVTLELGGKSPTIIDKSANLRSAARRIMWGKTINAGQTCIAPDYILCPKALQGELVKEMQTALKEFFPKGTKETEDFGCIINDRHHARLSNLMKEGKAVIGGEIEASTRYIAPTVYTGVNENSLIMKEEIFGPLLPIMDCESTDEAIHFINAREKPLALYLFADDKKVGDRIINETSSGAVLVNDTLMHASVPELPFGGVGNSGTGALHGKFGFDAFSHLKPIMRKGSGLEGLNGMRYAPYTPAKLTKLTKLLFKTPNFAPRGFMSKVNAGCVVKCFVVVSLAYLLAEKYGFIGGGQSKM